MGHQDKVKQYNGGYAKQTTYLTTQRNTVLATDSCSANQEILSFQRNPKFHCSVCNSMPPSRPVATAIGRSYSSAPSSNWARSREKERRIPGGVSQNCLS
jgi:hypothetical protein